MANKKIEKVTLQERVDSVKSSISEMHEEVLSTAHQMVDVSLESGAKWQKLMTKVLHQGTDLFEKQQDMTFNALEEVKSQFMTSNKRFKQLLGLNQTKAKKAAKLRKENGVRARKATTKVADLTAEVDADFLSTQDNLKELKGIGPKIESLLNEAGISSFYQLANASTERLQDVLKKAGSRYQSMNPTIWKSLAQAAITNRNN
ncbi:MAG: hypothetical protein AAFZ63_21995 [Bacteroidota bacterium]